MSSRSGYTFLNIKNKQYNKSTLIPKVQKKKYRSLSSNDTKKEYLNIDSSTISKNQLLKNDLNEAYIPNKIHEEINNTCNSDDDTINTFKYMDTPLQWFPGHMSKGFRKLREMIHLIDIVVEVRDSRVPFGSSNQEQKQLKNTKPRIIIFNKIDLCTSHMTKKIYKQYIIYMITKLNATENLSIDEKYINIAYKKSDKIPPPYKSKDNTIYIIFVNSKVESSMKTLLKFLKEISPTKKFKTIPTVAAICGYPNVGKSTIINMQKTIAQNNIKHCNNNNDFLNKTSTSRAKVGPLPGVTRDIGRFKISTNPLMMLLDTPGLMVPKFERTESGVLDSLKLASVGIIADYISGLDILAQFLLDQLNEHKIYKYVDLFDLPYHKPIQSFETLACYIAITYKWYDPNCNKTSKFQKQYEKTIQNKKYNDADIQGKEKYRFKYLENSKYPLTNQIQLRTQTHFISLYRKNMLGSLCLDMSPT